MDATAEDAPAGWHGDAPVLSARLVPRYAWQTASIRVTIGEQVVLETGGVLKLVGSVTQTFEHEGAVRQARLEWGRGTLVSFPCRLAIDGVPVLDERVGVANWRVGLWPWLPFAAGVAWFCWR